ncbi:MAG: SH3 domain-containing protein [Erysipelothrix sp.]|nr:SH3 domain-containing protein [Erysipelothrix sp.]
MNYRKKSILLLVILLMFGIFSSQSALPISANTAVIGPLVCDNYSLERITGHNTFEKINCYSSLSSAIDAMNKNSNKNLIIRHASSKSPMKIVAMDRGIVVNVPDRASSSDQSTTNLYRTTALNSTQRTYINTYNTLSYYGTVSTGNSYHIGIAGFKGYIKASTADLVPMIYVENNWSIYLGGNSSGNNVILNTISPNYYMVTNGEMNYYFSEINNSAVSNSLPVTHTFSSGAYAQNQSGWFTKISGSGDNTVYRVNNYSIRIRQGAGTNFALVSGNHQLNSGYTIVGSEVKINEWIKIKSYTIPASTNSKPARQYSVTSYGVAPSWLKANTRYYSNDGVTFYSDIDMTQRVSDQEYYNYFQFLPARSYTTHTAEQLNKFLVDRGYNSTAKSAMFNSGKHFINSQNTYFMNGLIVYAMAIHESAYGTSGYALNRNNLFGWNAIDSDPGQASYFESVEQAIREHMSVNLNGYLRLTDWRFAGTSVGQKEGGFNKQYASDPYWGLKISNYMYDFDKAFNQTDLHYYTVAKFPDNTAVNVRSSASTSSNNILYTTNSGLLNVTAVIVSESNGFYEILLQNKINDRTTGFVSKNSLTIINQGKGGEIPNPPTEPEPQPDPEPETETKTYRVMGNGLRVRSNPNTTSSILGSLNAGAQITGNLVESGTWLKITYQGKTGYISATYIEEVKPREAKVNVASTLGYTASGSVLTGMNLTTTITSVESKLKAKDSTITVSVKDSSGKTKSTSNNLATGDVMTVSQSGQSAQIFTIAVLGDINGDGKVNSLDVRELLLHINGHKSHKGSYLISADITKDGKLNSLDVRQVLLHINGHSNLFQ